MTNSFLYDVFLSHSSKDKAIVRPLAERLKGDGLRVWFDEWEIRPGESIPAKIEEGLELSRVLVLCMSANAFDSDWARLEASTFRFRDPLNRDRRFIPLRLDEAAIKGSLAQFLYVSWLEEERDREYPKLLEACRLSLTDVTRSAGANAVNTGAAGNGVKLRTIRLDYRNPDILAYSFSLDGQRILTGARDRTVRLWDLSTGRCSRVLKGHTNAVVEVQWSPDQRQALSVSFDKTLRLWDLETRRCLRILEGHTHAVLGGTWSSDQRFVVSASADNTARLWDAETGRCLRVFEGHIGTVFQVALSPDQRRLLSASEDQTIRMWDVQTGRCLRVFEGHQDRVCSLAWSGDGRYVLSSSAGIDQSVRLWDVESGRCLYVLEAPGDREPGLTKVAWRADNRLALSTSTNGTIRLWDLKTGRLLHAVRGHLGACSVAWTADQCRVLSGDWMGTVVEGDWASIIDAEAGTEEAPLSPPGVEQVQYTNAKVLLVGESGAGKTGLSQRLVSSDWKPSDSTVGAWATQWKLPVANGVGVEREIWLWDFGGQADQRLIHQLYMDETALAILVFDGQKDDVFDRLDQWDRDLTRGARKPLTKLLVAGRVDAGGLRVSRSDIEKFVRERGYIGFLETSAKINTGCDELRQAILDGIGWEELPCRTTEVLFKRLKEEIIRLKDDGRVLMRFNELRTALLLGSTSELRFTDEELRAVLTLLTGPGVVWELKFGSWVLLQPERINAYAQAVIQTLQADEYQRGCLLEDRVLRGDLVYHSTMERLAGDEEGFVLQAMYQVLLERGLCLRQPTDKNGNLLVFPSYYRRERPEQISFPAVLVSYRFTGFLDDIYATLVVRLHHHTAAFQQDRLWHYAADFRTNLGKQLGVKLTRLAPGLGELEVYFEPDVSVQEKIIFSKYVHEHLLQHAKDVERLRHYVCPHCGTAVGNREIAMKRLNTWLDGRVFELDTTGLPKLWLDKVQRPTIVCVECEERVPLWDELEEFFASSGVQLAVREMQAESAIVLDNESKERALVGEVISTVALAGQIGRELTVSDHGIDMEIEFKDDRYEATGQKIYLQLKSGDSYLRDRQRDGAEIFTIKDERHARYWMAQKFPVLLVIRTGQGEIRWMEVRDWLKRESGNGNRSVNQIVFEGESFDVMSVRRWRDKVLNEKDRRRG